MKLFSVRTCLPTRKQVLSIMLSAAIGMMPLTSRAQEHGKDGKPGTAVTPIQHVIVVFGENRSFDHVFGTYVPKRPDQFVYNLLSEGIVDANGKPSWNYGKSGQYSAIDDSSYEISPGGKVLYTHVPAIAVGGPEFAADQECSSTVPEPCRSAGFTGPFLTTQVAKEYEPYLFPTYYPFMLTGATGLPSKTVDTRITDNGSLPSGVVQLTAPGPTGSGLKYTDYSSSPVHRFYQMWQQTDCDKNAIDFLNPSGCQSDLFAWVEVSIGAGSNGKKPPSPFNDLSTGEGGTSLEFYNVQTGDAPYLKHLADRYTLSDNMHQGIMGGTGPNHVYLGYADVMWFDSSSGWVPPDTPKTPNNTPPSNQVEDPNPLAGYNNWYMQDGYSGGTYTNCADTTQPGVAPIVNYLTSLPEPIKPHCDAGHYYLLNNYNPAYNADGSSAFLYSPFTIPPTSQPHIGDVLAKAGLSYTFFGEDWNIYKTDPAGANPMDAYCNICNPFQYAKDIMTDPKQIAEHIADVDVFYSDVANNKLPNVSIIQPSGFADGHPASSKLQIFEGFVKDIVTTVKHSPAWSSTVIFVIFDEGGGYYDSGYIQPLDFFGDGTRMPFLVISPYSTGGYVNHSYADHVSIDKFIERNWNLPTISNRSRDNLPNPETFPWDPYVPLNSPAITDLFDAFHFDNCDLSDED